MAGIGARSTTLTSLAAPCLGDFVPPPGRLEGEVARPERREISRHGLEQDRAGDRRAPSRLVVLIDDHGPDALVEIVTAADARYDAEVED